MVPGKRYAVRIASALVVALAVGGVLGYHFYGDIKRALLSGLSSRITEIAGQRVVIGDVSVGPRGTIDFHTIEIGNPEGFEGGNLLAIDRVRLSLVPGELFSGRLHLPEIEISSPQLILSKDRGGRLNVSEKLKGFLKARSEVKYRIGELTIEGGSLGFMGETTHQVDHVNLKLRHLSSEQGTKTLVTGSAGYAQGSIGVDGWAYLRDDSMKFSVSVSVRDVMFPKIRDLHKDAWAQAEQMVFAFDVQAEGDMGKSIALTTQGRMASPGRLHIMKQNLNEIRLDGRASYNISDDVLTVHDVSLYAGQVIGGRLTGVITDVREAPRYDVNITIERLDVAALAMPGGMTAGGIVSSDAIRVKGKLGEGVPHAKGALVITDASLRAKTVDLNQLNARVNFDAEEEVSLSAEASLKILMAGGYALHEPSALVASLRAGGDPAAIAVSASLALSAFRVDLGGNRDARVERVHLETKGTLKRDIFRGEADLKLRSLEYTGYGAVNAEAAFTVDYAPGETRLSDIVLDAGGLRSSASRVAIRGSEMGSAFTAEARGLNILDPLRKIEVVDADVSLSVNVQGKRGSGVFSVVTAAFDGFRLQGMSGSGRISEEEFSIEIPRAEIAGGRLRLTAQGRTSDGPFPVTADIAAEGVDSAHLSKALSPFVKIPYSVSGTIKRIAFRGTLGSVDSLHGNASLEGQNITVLENEKGRAISREALFTVGTVFKGKDLEFTAEGTSGRVSATASGLAREFAREERILTVHASLPETNIADIRTSFWDIVPDSLLYLGLEGSLSSDIAVRWEKNRLSGRGDLRLKDIRIEGENGEYSVGPVNGIIPVLYGDPEEEGRQLSIPPHARSELESIRRHYSGEFTGTGLGKVSLGSFRYGFPLLDDVTLWVRQEGALLDIGRLTANMFGGRLYASGVVDVSGGPDYRLGVLLEGMSLKQLCDRIEPIRGYLSGNVDGIGTFRGSGTGLAQLTGMADFWTYRTQDETTRISKEFLQKVGGPSMKAYLGDRPFNKGSMSILVKDGYVLFRELEISNRNVLGVQDLSVKVAPLNNRIAIDHLLWSLAEAGERAQKE